MSEDLDIHPTIQLDDEVEQKNESSRHWAIKAAIVERLRSDSSIEGIVDTERKTSDLIGDVLCELSESPPGIPNRFVVEIETPSSNKDRVRATCDHLRFGYSVYWIFTKDAASARQSTEDELSEYMTTPPSFGIASLEDGRISMGSPIVWDEFSLPTPWLGRHELYIPTYDRYVSCFNHGDFEVENERVTVYRRPSSGVLFVSRYLEDGQRTLPQRASWETKEFLTGIRTGEIERVSPVEGPP